MAREGEFKPPDVKAPRHRKKDYSIYGIDRKGPASFFRRLKKQYPHLAKYTDKQIMDWIYKFNSGPLSHEILYTRYGVELFGNMGCMFMGVKKICKRFRMEKAAVNVPLSKEAGKIIPVVFTKADGLWPFIFYTNWANRIRFVNAKFWTFTPCRKLERGKKAALYEDHRKYMEIKNNRFISSMIRG